MTELKPCPFCGGKVIVEYFPVYAYPWQVICRNPKLSETNSHTCFVEADTEQEAIEAWNTRAERTCKIKPWRMEEDTGFYDCLECECGHVMDGSEWAKSTYCPNCCAKVVGD